MRRLREEEEMWEMAEAEEARRLEEEKVEYICGPWSPSGKYTIDTSDSGTVFIDMN